MNVSVEKNSSNINSNDSSCNLSNISNKNKPNSYKLLDKELYDNNNSDFNSIFNNKINNILSYEIIYGWFSTYFKDYILETEFSNTQKKFDSSSEKIGYISTLIYCIFPLVNYNYINYYALKDMTYFLEFQITTTFIIFILQIMLLLSLKYKFFINLKHIISILYYITLNLLCGIYIIFGCFGNFKDKGYIFSSNFYTSIFAVLIAYTTTIKSSKSLSIATAIYFTSLSIISSIIHSYYNIPYFKCDYSSKLDSSIFIEFNNKNLLDKYMTKGYVNNYVNMNYNNCVLKTPNIIYIVELVVGSLFFLQYYIKNKYESSNRHNFLNMKKIQNIYNYYVNFINEIDCQVVSFYNKDIVYANSEFIFNSSLEYEIKTKYTNSNNNLNKNKFIKEPIKYVYLNDLFNYTSNIEKNEYENSDKSNEYTLLNLVEYLQSDELNIFDKLKLKEINCKKTNIFKKLLKNINKYNFFDIGIFYTKNNLYKKYYQVIIRKFNIYNQNYNNLNNSLRNFTLNRDEFSTSLEDKLSFNSLKSSKDKYIIDIVMKDITKIIESEREAVEYCLKSKLFSKMAHEFKTPLIIISTEVSELASELGSIMSNSNVNNSQQYIQKCNDLNYVSKYCLFLIDDIIHYASGCKKDYKILLEDVDNLEDLICFSYKALLSYKSLIFGNKTKLECEYYIDPRIKDYTITTDILRLKQIMLNLLSNAIKFTKKGFVKIQCTLLKKEYSNDSYEIEISVIDTGIGFTKEDLSRLNLSFGEKDNKYLSNIKINNPNIGYNYMGTGIGISVVRSLLSMLPGHRFNIVPYPRGTCCNINIDAYAKKNNEEYANNINQTLDKKDVKKVISNPLNEVKLSNLAIKDLLLSERKYKQFSCNNLRDYNNTKKKLLKNINFFNLNNEYFKDSNEIKQLENNLKSKSIKTIKINSCSKLYNCNNYCEHINQIVQNNNLEHSCNQELTIYDYIPKIKNKSKFEKNYNKNQKNCNTKLYEEISNYSSTYSNDDNNLVEAISLNNSNNNINILSNSTKVNNSFNSTFYNFKNKILNINYETRFSLQGKALYSKNITNNNNNNYNKLLIKTNLNNINYNNNCSNNALINFNTYINNSIDNNNNYVNYFILIIDDSPPLRKAIINLFKKSKFKQNQLNKNINYNLIELSDGVDFVNTVKYIECFNYSNSYNKFDNEDSYSIKLALIDENMEFLNGSESIRIIKNFQINKKIKPFKIISLTAFVDIENLKTIKNSGADLVISKPLDKEKLEKCLKLIE